jgi:hypothetical protein
VKRSWTLNGLMIAAALLLPLTAATESQVGSAASGAALSATAQINFKIVIPKTLFLQIGREGVILIAGIRKGVPHHALCAPDATSALPGSRTFCTASLP